MDVCGGQFGLAALEYDVIPVGTVNSAEMNTLVQRYSDIDTAKPGAHFVWPSNSVDEPRGRGGLVFALYRSRVGSIDLLDHTSCRGLDRQRLEHERFSQSDEFPYGGERQVTREGTKVSTTVGQCVCGR
jgi:hypothetical protein